MIQPTGASWGKPKKKFTAYIVFQGKSDRGFWHFFTKPAWRHCWVMVPAYWPEPGLMATTVTMKIEPLKWGIDTEVWWEPPEVIAQAFLDAGATAVVAFPVENPPSEGYVFRGLFTCVVVVKAVLGINNWRLWTPWQLFRYLLRNNGTLAGDF